MSHETAKEAGVKSMYRRLPKVGEYLDGPELRDLLAGYPRALIRDCVRAVILGMREEIGDGRLTETMLEGALDKLPELVEAEVRQRRRHSLRPVINATGVILQTNLGRAPLSEEAIARITAVAGGYCNLEFDLESGERGQRGADVERLLLQLLAGGSRPDVARRGALVVNNCCHFSCAQFDRRWRGGDCVARGVGGDRWRIPRSRHPSQIRRHSARSGDHESNAN